MSASESDALRRSAFSTTKKTPAAEAAGGLTQSISRVLSRLTARGDHSSGTLVTERLERPTLELGRAALKRSSTWPCSKRGLPCRRRYRLRGGLLPHRFTLTHGHLRARRRFVFCCTFLEVSLTGRYPASCPAEPGLSSRPKPSDRLSRCDAAQTSSWVTPWRGRPTGRWAV